ncbi:cell division protein FtsX [Nitratifractor sp.]|uniref:cell division protein FtsX n=1 Tax=Nitratifractor sp. TaxID=2268144 RepID=UPI0025DE6A4F|nr:cell division protein FtsX [Nitratifractor sp.]
MKSVRDHLMFLLPLLAILLGVEFFLVFNRVTQHAEEKLRESYSILVVSEQPMSLKDFRRIDPHISQATPISKAQIAKEIARGMKNTPDREILAALPHFYNLHLDRYLSRKDVAKIRQKLLAVKGIDKVETFGENHRAKYNLFIFLKIIFWSFVGLMSLVSIFLVVKQMEVWQMAHQERMQIMEIFGAPMLLRSGVLFRMGIVDALLATGIAAGIFALLRYYYAPISGIEILMDRQALLFRLQDVAILGGIALMIVISAVLTVAVKSRGPRE